MNDYEDWEVKVYDTIKFNCLLFICAIMSIPFIGLVETIILNANPTFTEFSTACGACMLLWLIAQPLAAILFYGQKWLKRRKVNQKKLAILSIGGGKRPNHETPI